MRSNQILICHMRTPTHAVHIRQDGHKVAVFKYNNCQCELELFTDFESATEYIMEPLPSIHYWVDVAEDHQA
jgi:hypothetical protein